MHCATRSTLRGVQSSTYLTRSILIPTVLVVIGLQIRCLPLSQQSRMTPPDYTCIAWVVVLSRQHARLATTGGIAVPEAAPDACASVFTRLSPSHRLPPKQRLTQRNKNMIPRKISLRQRAKRRRQRAKHTTRSCGFGRAVRGLGLCPRCSRLCSRCFRLGLCPWCSRRCPRCFRLGLCASAQDDGDQHDPYGWQIVD